MVIAYIVRLDTICGNKELGNIIDKKIKALEFKAFVMCSPGRRKKIL